VPAALREASRTTKETIAMRVKLSTVVVATAFAVLTFAGCGGDDDDTTTAAEGGTTTTATAAGTAGAGGQTVEISETEYEIDPSDPSVQPGTVSFEITNDGGVDHNLEVEGPEGEQELEQDLAPGESGTLTVDLSQPGSYEMYCPVGNHRDLGMEGEITVGGGAAGGGPDDSSDDSGNDSSSNDSDDDSTGSGGASGYGY
jgi:uncharacterized cupredoxin-like copper-binding protein